MSYPLPVFHFQVEWGGNNLGFAEVSGLTMETQIIEYRDGLSPVYGAQKMPGIPKFANVTLKRGVVPKDNEFYDWLNTTQLNKVERRDVTISLLNENHEPTMSWKLKAAWPVKVMAPGLKATGNEAAIESLELAHEGLTIENR